MKRCFVIMPYGGDSDQRRKHYEGIYQSIIAPAATRAGYEPKRSDIAGEPGNITHDIIKDLAESDVVIADLTEGNANVFFELGIRHAFRKSGTVHIVNQEHLIPFDVRQYRTLTYSTDLADLPDVITSIAEAIRRRESQPLRPDNPVHDAIPSLPTDLRSTGEAAYKQQLEELQAEVAQLQQEKEALQKALAELTPAARPNGDGHVDIDAILDEADTIMQSTGEHAIFRLAEAAERGGDAFVKALREVLKNRFLEENDFVQIANMCRNLSLPEHARAVLEVAVQRFPGEDDFVLALVESYEKSPSPALKERGRALVEEYLGVEHTGDDAIFRGVPKPKALSALGILFDIYRRIGKHRWILQVAEAGETVFGADSVLLRNKASALAALGKSIEAENEFKRALESDPLDDTAHTFYGHFLSEQGRYQEAYQECERAVVCDPDDGTRWSNLAINIFNFGYVRDASARIVGPLARRTRIKFAFPLLKRGLEDKSREGILRPHVITVLVRAQAMTEAKAIAENSTAPGEYDGSAVRFLEEQIAANAGGS